jgi:hypothetical protein
LDEIGEVASVFALLEVTHDHLAREAAVFIADTDRSEERWSFWMGGDEARDAFPEQEEWCIVALVFRTHEGAAKFEGRADLHEQPFVITKDSVGVESFDAMGANDLIRIPSAVSSS